MRIDTNTSATLSSLQQNSPAQRAATSGVSSDEGDGVTAELSCDAKAIGNLTAGDDVRQDRVAALKQQIESGSYQVNADAIATSMMDTMPRMRFTV